MPESNISEKSLLSSNGNKDVPKNLSDEPSVESQDGKSKHTEYIPSQVSSIATSGINTVSNDRSGQCSTQSVRKNEGITDSKTYHESKAMYKTDLKEEEDSEPINKKRKVDADESSSKENEEASTSIICDSTSSQDITLAKLSSDCKGDNAEKQSVSEVNPNSYLPSEYGSFQNSGGISTFTKSCFSATEKIPSQSTDSSNSKGGIVHEDTKEDKS